jgi:hypothetical protein
MSEWGYVWESLDRTIGQPTGQPLADLSRLPGYRAPDPLAPGRMDLLPAAIAPNQDRFVKAGLGISGFNQATFLRGFEALLEDLYTDRGNSEWIDDFAGNLA